MTKLICFLIVGLPCLWGGAALVVSPTRYEYACALRDGFADLEKYFKSEDWYIKGCFFDVDGDGCEEALLTTPDLDIAYECSWLGFYRSETGAIKEMYDSELGSLPCSLPWELFVYEQRFHPPTLVKCETRYPQKESSGFVYYDEHITVLNNKEKLVSLPIEGGIEQWICHPRFRRLSPAPLSKFEGFDLRETVYGTFTPLPDNPVMPPPSAGLKTLIQNYLQKIKTQYNLTQKFAVYTISMDADNDGDEDVYISSYPERVKGDQLKWHLYMNRKGVYRPATKNMWISDPTSKRHGDFLEVLDPEETASPFAFFRLFHYGVPRIIIFDNKRGRGLTYTYLKLISSEDHARRPPEGIGDADRSSDWHIEMKEKNGCSVPFTVREYLMSGNVVIERIPCRVDVE